MWVGAQMERKWSADNGMDSWPAPVSNEVMDWVQSVHTLHPGACSCTGHGYSVLHTQTVTTVDQRNTTSGPLSS